MIIKASNPEAARFGSEVAEWLAERGAVVIAEEAHRDIIPISPAEYVLRSELPDRIDVLIVLGGDGTMLSGGRLLDGRKVPVLGVNMGGLGFLTAITTEELFPMLERVLADDFKIEERMMLSVSVTRNGGEIATHDVMNDAVVKSYNARLVRLETSINKDFVTTYRADGLIVATPTGSTAYSLSAAGPILYPTIHSIIVAPICPFNLTNRPVVIPDWMTVDLKVCPDQTDVMLMLDGQVDLNLVCGDTVHIRRSEKSVYLIRYEGKSYFDILRERLMWEVKAEAR